MQGASEMSKIAWSLEGKKVGLAFLFAVATGLDANVDIISKHT